MNAGKVSIALSPYEFGSVKGGYDVEEELSSAKVEHEDRCALQVDDEDLARESGDKEKERT